MSHFRRSVPFLLAATVANMASAVTYFRADLTNAGETAAVLLTDDIGNPRPESFGFAEFWLNDAETELTMTATIFNIDVTGLQTASTQDNLVNAHIHANETVMPGQNASVVWGFLGSPDNDNTPDNLMVTPFVSEVGGTISSIWNAPEGNGGTTLTAQLSNILGGHAYLNFHTVQNPGGEIRGHLLVPEPASLSLVVLPVLALLRRHARGR